MAAEVRTFRKGEMKKFIRNTLTEINHGRCNKYVFLDITLVL